MSGLKRPGPGSVGLVMGIVGWGLQVAYRPEEHPLVLAGAKWFVAIGIGLLTYWALEWARRTVRERRGRTPQIVESGTLNIASGLHAHIADIVTLSTSSWHTTCSTAGGEVLPSMEGLLISLRHSESMPEGIYLCDVLVAGRRARARVPSKPGADWISAIYPREFTEGEAVPLPLPPGVHHAAWRDIRGATSDFLVGLKITVPSSGDIQSEESAGDPMEG